MNVVFILFYVVHKKLQTNLGEQKLLTGASFYILVVHLVLYTNNKPTKYEINPY